MLYNFVVLLSWAGNRVSSGGGRALCLVSVFVDYRRNYEEPEYRSGTVLGTFWEPNTVL